MAERSFTSWRAPITLFGIGVRVHLSWILMALLIGWSLASTVLPALYPGLAALGYISLALLIVAGLGISIVLHEFAHALVARAYGMRVSRITLFLLGGLAELESEPSRPGAELAMAAAGPAFSVAFAAVLTLASGAASLAGLPGVTAYALAYLATLNLVVAVFNLAPAFPLDGGRVLRAVLWMTLKDQRRATAWAARVSGVLAMLLVGLGLATLFVAGLAEGLWWILIGLFLRVAARSELLGLDARQTYAGHPVGEVMVPAPETLPADMTLGDFVRERLISARHSLYPVTAGGEWVGTLDPADVLRIPRHRWSETTIGEICTPAAVVPTARADDDAAQLIERMQQQETPRLVVADRGAVVGLVTLQDLLRGVRLRRRFGVAGA